MDPGGITIFIVLLGLGYFFGTTLERMHFKSIRERERKFLNLPAVTFEKSFDHSQVRRVEFASGNVVISIDYFKRILAALRNIFGGNIGSYETLIDRGRREAILRLKEQHPDASVILNLRIETSSIGRSANRRNSIGSIEVLAYGTAIWL